MRLTSAKLAVLMLVGLSATTAPAVHAADARCLVKHGGFGPCASGLIGGGAVDLSASERHDDSPPVAPVGPVAPTRHPEQPASAGPPAPPQVHHPVVPRNRLAADVDVPCQPGMGSCLDGRHAFLPPAKAPAQPVDPAPVVPAAAGVSVEDVAQFVPRDASMRSQPNGWALVGAPVNLLTDAGPEVVDGTLLGRPAQVRFVPVSFTWDHGDGTTVTVQGPGGSWRDLGQRDFTATSTSHVYGQVGEREVTLSIGYAASYRFDGGGWQQIAGTLPVQVGPVMLRVLEGSTVLVGGVCGSPDAGPGC
jgi:hypothetical protein